VYANTWTLLIDSDETSLPVCMDCMVSLVTNSLSSLCAIGDRDTNDHFINDAANINTLLPVPQFVKNVVACWSHHRRGRGTYFFSIDQSVR